MLSQDFTDELKAEYVKVKILYKYKKEQVKDKLVEYSVSKAPEVDRVQNELDSIRRELVTIRTYKKTLKKLLKTVMDFHK